MRLDLREVLRTPGASRAFSDMLDLSGLDFNGVHIFRQPVKIDGTVRNAAGALLLEGEARAEMDLICGRCLTEFTRALCLPVSCLLAEELEDEENDEIYLLEDGAVDLDEVFTTAIVLNMDSRHLCREDCKGLCPGCGVNLNEEPCRCRKEIDPRLSVLAQKLRGGVTNGSSQE